MSEDKLEIGIYWWIDEDTNQKVYDEDSMREEFEDKLDKLLNKTKMDEDICPSSKSSMFEDEETFEDCLVFINQRVKKLGNQLADPYLETQLSQLCQMFGLSKYEPAADGLKSFVPKAVKNRGTQARAAAIWSLGHIYEDRPQPELAVVLVDRLSDVDINNPELFPVRAASAVAIARMNNQDQLEALREWLKKESPKGMIGYSCAWGINRLTGEPIPALKPVNYKKLGWFLTPFSKS